VSDSALLAGIDAIPGAMRERVLVAGVVRKRKLGGLARTVARLLLVRESGSLRLSRRRAPLGHRRPSQASIRTPPCGRRRAPGLLAADASVRGEAQARAALAHALRLLARVRWVS
jgi:hypothetical protein